MPAWVQIATIVSNPVLMTTLFMLQGKVLISSARPSHEVTARSSQLSPPTPVSSSKNTIFPFCLCCRHRLSFCLGWRLLVGKNAHCLLSTPVSVLLFRGLALLLQNPASFSCRASILDGVAILGLEVSRSLHFTRLLKTRPKPNKEIVQYHFNRPALLAVTALLDTAVGNG